MHAEPISRIVVTGAAGFIGTSLVRRLRRDRFTVLAIVRSDPPTRARAEGVQYIVRDLERIDSLADVLRAGDVVMHLAARVHQMNDRDGDAHAAYRSANVEVARMLCHSMAECGSRRLVFLSTAKVFGEGRDRPYRHDDPLAPADEYAASKADAEQAVRALADGKGFEWTIVRPPFVYGPG